MESPPVQVIVGDVERSRLPLLSPPLERGSPPPERCGCVLGDLALTVCSLRSSRSPWEARRGVVGSAQRASASAMRAPRRQPLPSSARRSDRVQAAPAPAGRRAVRLPVAACPLPAPPRTLRSTSARGRRTRDRRIARRIGSRNWSLVMERRPPACENVSSRSWCESTSTSKTATFAGDRPIRASATFPRCSLAAPSTSGA